MDQNPALMEFLQTRRTIPAPQLQAPGPDRAEVERILTIASRVPDHGKLAPWRFIVFSGDVRAELGTQFLEIATAQNTEMNEQQRQAELERFTRAPLVIVVVSTASLHPKIPEWEQHLSAGASCMSLLMAANASGYAASWLTEWIAFDEDAKAAMGVNPNEKVAGIVHIGTPKVPPTERPRPELDDIVTWQGVL